MSVLGQGTPHPYGATLTEDGVNFSIFSENAASVTLELYRDPYDFIPVETIKMDEVTNFSWHVDVSGLKAGTLYGYRIDGPYEPESGYRFNRNKLLIDPYAKALSGTIKWDDSIFGYSVGREDGDLAISRTDSSEFVPKCVVIDPAFNWRDINPPRTSWRDTIIYETHMKGSTILNERIPKELRGTYLGLGSYQMIEYFQDLGITAVELMPIHHRIDDRFLVERGLRNYWGYNTVSYFAPDIRFSSSHTPGDQVSEFKTMVRNFHNAGIEVILDVVYNHTGEGNHLGPTLNFRGIDNSIYYRLNEESPRFYNDFTGTGNSLNARHPQVLQLIMDSLRYWVTEMHVDGFRFDLAATLARQLHDVDRLSAFFDIIHQDPVLTGTKLIAEPWDVGPGGYQVGNFPIKWAEWNGKYRDTVRRFWRGDEGLLGEFVTRLSGSPDLYEISGRKPHASINYITAHDGFTIYDLVSYAQKHNEANGDNNKDGTDENYSVNFGAEGDTDDVNIQEKRFRRIKNMFITLLSSQGVPMILGGDEMGRTQRGNNNAYCQDNEVSWYNWRPDERKKDLLEFLKVLISLRKSIPSLRRTDFYTGTYKFGGDVKDVLWLRPDGHVMDNGDWSNPSMRCIQILVSGTVRRPYGELEHFPDTIILINASGGNMEFKLPRNDKGWSVMLNSYESPDIMPVALGLFEHTLPEDSTAILMTSPLAEEE